MREMVLKAKAPFQTLDASFYPKQDEKAVGTFPGKKYDYQMPSLQGSMWAL